MKKFQLVILLVFMAAILGSCENTDVGLKLKNNSKDVIAFDCGLDTIPDSENNNFELFLRDKIYPQTKVTMIKPGDTDGWYSLIKKSVNNKLNVFIINIDTLQKYNDWKYIRKNKLYKRYEYTEEELNKKGWVIEYP